MYASSWAYPKEGRAKYWDNQEVRSDMNPKSQMTNRALESESSNLPACTEDMGIGGSQPC